MSGPSPNYDVFGAIPPGFVLQRSVWDGLMAAYAANGFQPLTAAQALAVTGPAPVYPASLPTLKEPGDSPVAF